MLSQVQRLLGRVTAVGIADRDYRGKIAEELNVDTYFSHPYRSWERGLNENHNGLIRQYLPKGQPLEKVTKKQVIDI